MANKKKNQKFIKKVKPMATIAEESDVQGSSKKTTVKEAAVSRRSPNFWNFLQFYQRDEGKRLCEMYMKTGEYAVFASNSLKSGKSSILETVLLSETNAIEVYFELDESTGLFRSSQVPEGHNVEEVCKPTWKLHAPLLKTIKPYSNRFKKFNKREFTVIRPMGSFDAAKMFYVQLKGKEEGSENIESEFGITKKVPLKARTIDHVKLMDEVYMITAVQCPFIVKLLGMCYTNGTAMITEACVASLYCVLQAKRGQIGQAIKLKWSIQAAEALSFLHIVALHRNVKSQNFFVTSDMTLKLGNFANADTLLNLQYKDYHRSLIKWLAPETLSIKSYNILSETWSYGILVWEIYAEGREPYGAMSNIQVRNKMRSSEHFCNSQKQFVMIMPKKTPEDVACLIEQCWKHCGCCRPNLGCLLAEFKELYAKWTD